jgi:uncharacterized protein (DUF885 family)
MARLLTLAVAVLVLLPLATSPLAAQDSPTPAEQLHDLFDREWEQRLRNDPLMATGVGRHEWNDELPTVTPESIAEEAEQTGEFLAELGAIDRSKLDRTDQVSYDIFERQLQLRLAAARFGNAEMPFNADSGFHTGMSRLAQEVPLATVEDYENYISRLHAMPRYFGEEIAMIRRGMARGMVLPRVVLEGYERTIATHVVDSPESSVFWPPFESFPSTVPASEHARLREAGAKAIREGAVPAYRTFLEFFEGDYLPTTRETIGASELPNGREFYQQQIRNFTSLELTPEEIHQIGLDEVKRIRAEMEAVIEEVGFDGSFAEFLEFLRTDPQFYAETPEELLRYASRLSKIADGKLPALFGRLPRLPYTVEPVPDDLAPKYTTGRYVGAPEGSTRPGIYWVNTYDLSSRPLYNMEALTLHEAVPGHHLQIALAAELEELPNFRRFSYISAFGEGWGLYSEHLGSEMGFYQDPYSNFGRLTYEMWRAARLVVDTGMHALGWSRQQTLDFLAENTALPLHEVRTETDRYISWPAQALAYKLGELEIKRLRAKAERELGTDFDVRAFHDAVLANGSVPLGVLADEIDRWIAGELAGGDAAGR